MSEDSTRDMAIESRVKLIEIEKKVVELQSSLSDISGKLDRLLTEREAEHAERRGQLKVIGMVSAIFGAVFGFLSPYLAAMGKAFVAAMH